MSNYFHLALVVRTVNSPSPIRRLLHPGMRSPAQAGRPAPSRPLSALEAITKHHLTASFNGADVAARCVGDVGQVDGAWALALVERCWGGKWPVLVSVCVPLEPV